MIYNTQDQSHYFSGICVNLCKGLCCKPWWGIIAYSAGKDGGAGAAQFRAELIKGMKARCTRIMDAYVTNEKPPRRLFKPPQRYNLILKTVRPTPAGFTLDLIAMFAFECLYLADDNTCSIHPARSAGRDIRPPHCAALGTPGAIEGGKGFCRIIHAAEASQNAQSDERDKAVTMAWESEKETSQRHYAASKPTVEEAVDAVMGRISEYMPQTAQVKGDGAAQAKAGRNDPCPCGSGQKFKKCHGR